MKKITFLRHASITGNPGVEYENTSFDKLNDLATLKHDPGISSIDTRNKLLENNKIYNYQLLLHGPSKRAIQTARIISKIGDKRIKSVKNNNLREIRFTPKKLITQDEYIKNGMPILREKLFKSILSDRKNSESLTKIIKRVQKLEQQLGKYKELNIICITNGFYMRFLYLYFVKNKKEVNQFNMSIILKAPNFSNLSSFTINI